MADGLFINLELSVLWVDGSAAVFGFGPFVIVFASYFLFVCVLGLIYSEYLLFNCFVVVKHSPKFLFIYVKEVLPAESKAVTSVLFII